MEFFESAIAMIAANDGISLSTAQSAQIQQPLKESCTWCRGIEARRICSVCGK